MAALKTCAQGALPPAHGNGRPAQQPVGVPAAGAQKPAGPPVFRHGHCLVCLRVSHNATPSAGLSSMVVYCRRRTLPGASNAEAPGQQGTCAEQPPPGHPAPQQAGRHGQQQQPGQQRQQQQPQPSAQPASSSAGPELVGPAHRVAQALQARQAQEAAPPGSQGTDSHSCSPPVAAVPVNPCLVAAWACLWAWCRCRTWVAAEAGHSCVDGQIQNAHSEAQQCQHCA